MCANCGCSGQSSKLKKCTRCVNTAYCNKACQTAHWSTHRHQCKLLQLRVVPARLMVDLVWTQDPRLGDIEHMPGLARDTQESAFCVVSKNTSVVCALPAAVLPALKEAVKILLDFPRERLAELPGPDEDLLVRIHEIDWLAHRNPIVMATLLLKWQ